MARPRGILYESMIDFALRATSHVAAWLIWHSTGVSLLADLDAPRPPQPERA
jgi:hypothetical protein